MEQSTNFGFNLPSRDTDDIADINLISENFSKIDTELSEMIKGKGVDQSYSPTSKNPQSGTAVAEAVSNFVSLEDNTEWVFDGGDASGSVDIDLVIDDEMSGTSNNLVPNKVIKQYVDNLFASIYPIGSIYMSANDTSPSVLFGGEWERIKDRFLLSAGDIYESGLIGGEAEHTLTVEEMPGHSHSGTPKYYRAASVSAGTEENAQTGTQGWTGETGGNQPHNNMPPYLTVYMWKRIA